MTETEFNSLAAQGYNRIPVTLETFADLDTPLSIYLKLTSGPNNGHYSYLLESVQGGERFGRYSIIGLAAQTRIVVHGHQVLVLTGNRVAERENDTNPLTLRTGRVLQQAGHLLPVQRAHQITGRIHHRNRMRNGALTHPGVDAAQGFAQRHAQAGQIPAS